MSQVTAIKDRSGHGKCGYRAIQLHSAGQLTAQKYPSRRVVETEIDNFRTKAEVSDSERTHISGITFNNRGDNDSLTYKQVFDFDRFGSLYRKAANNPTTGQQNPLPYTPIEDSDISKSTNRFTSGTTYDQAGQVITDNKFREMAFSYDAKGRMVKATKQNQPDAWTVYDALGNRVAGSTSSSTISFEEPCTVVKGVSDSDSAFSAASATSSRRLSRLCGKLP